MSLYLYQYTNYTTKLLSFFIIFFYMCFFYIYIFSNSFFLIFQKLISFLYKFLDAKHL